MISLSSSRAVATSTGTEEMPRIMRRASPPSRSGSPRSRTTASTGAWVTSRSAPNPSAALRTAYPCSVRTSISDWRMLGSSSTIRTLGMGTP